MRDGPRPWPRLLAACGLVLVGTTFLPWASRPPYNRPLYRVANLALSLRGHGGGSFAEVGWLLWTVPAGGAMVWGLGIAGRSARSFAAAALVSLLTLAAAVWCVWVLPGMARTTAGVGGYAACAAALLALVFSALSIRSTETQSEKESRR